MHFSFFSTKNCKCILKVIFFSYFLSFIRTIGKFLCDDEKTKIHVYLVVL